MKIAAAMPNCGTPYGLDNENMRIVAAERERPSAAAKRGDATMGMYPHVLASFAYGDMSATKLPGRVEGARMVWVDSGAFTVWTRGGSIDLDAYVAHLHALRDALAVPVIPINLDVIPGGPRRRATPDEARAAIQASERNADAIRAADLPVMEVWHRGEPLEHLDRVLARREPGELVGIGGLVGLRPDRVRAVCDPVWARVLATHPLDALPPIHGLGVGNRDVIWRYPWWSVDSSSWTAPGVWGRKLTRSGSTVRDARTSNAKMRRNECAHVLRTWLRWASELDALWERRGVRYATPPPA